MQFIYISIIISKQLKRSVADLLLLVTAFSLSSKCLASDHDKIVIALASGPIGNCVIVTTAADIRAWKKNYHQDMNTQFKEENSNQPDIVDEYKAHVS